jgi:hypothetical protein
MRRRAALIGTVVLHVAVLGGLLAIPERQALGPIVQRRPIVEIVEVVRPPKPAPTRVASRETSGGGTRSDAVAPAVRHVTAPPAPGPAIQRISLQLDGGAGRGRGGGTGTGDGEGIGAGTGGLGGTAGTSDAAIAHLAIPPPQPVSKARPAKLIYPANNRDAEANEQFIARVDVDQEGFVVGAKLVQGFGGPRDEQASSLIWRFRYAPALDDAGRPVRSTLDQPFLVGR